MITKWKTKRNTKLFFYNEAVKNFVKRLPKSLLAKYALARDLMVEFGPNIGGKYTKAMGKGLFELRLQASEGIARVFSVLESVNKLCFCMVL